MDTVSKFKAAARSAFHKQWMKYAEGIETTTLTNGVEIVTHFIPSIFHPFEPRKVDYNIILQGGGLNETDPATRGIFHFYEHMTSEASLGFAAPIEDGSGFIPGTDGSFSAQANSFATSLSMDSKARNKGREWRALADKVSQPILNAQAFEKHRSMIDAEKVLRDSEEVFKKYPRILATMFGGKPDDYDNVGTRDTINNITLDDLIKHGAEHVRTDRIVVAAEGAIGHREFVNMVCKSFNDLPRGERLPRVEPAYIGGYNAKPKLDVDGTTVDLIFNCGTGKDENENHNGAAASRIRREIMMQFRDNGFLYDVKASDAAQLHLNTMEIQFTALPEKVEKALSIILDTLDKAMAPSISARPKLTFKEKLDHPLRAIKPYYTHSFADTLLHPIQTAQNLMNNRIKKRTGRSLAYEHMMQGKTSSRNGALHDYLSATPEDTARVIERMREHPVTLLVEGNPKGFPDYVATRDMFQIKPKSRNAASDQRLIDVGPAAPGLTTK